MINQGKTTRLNKRKQFELEPGLLSVFQMVMGVLLVLQLLSLGVYGYLRYTGASPEIEVLFGWLNFVEFFLSVAMMCYLFSARLRERLNLLYLPIVVAIYSAGVIALRYAQTFYLVTDPNLAKLLGTFKEIGYRVDDSVWSLLLSLLVPLVIVAWQYDFKRVLLFVGAVTLFEVPLVWMLFSFTQVGVLLDLITTTSGLNVGDSNGPPSQLIQGILFITVPRNVIFLTVGYIVTRMIGAQRQQRTDRAEANDKLHEHAAIAEQLTISRERNRMARELHDTLAHSLSAVSVQLEAVDSALESSPEDARRLLNRALAQTRSGLAETRRALQSLRASPLDDLGLKLSLHTLSESMAKRGGMKLDLQLEEVGELPPATEQNIYRIAQEALTNVVKHANASKVGVTLMKPNGKVVLTVRDNGIGFDPSIPANNGHFGLHGIHERAELIGAEIEVESKPGQGTTVRLVA